MRVAAIDIGTNTVLLLVAELRDGALVAVDFFPQINGARRWIRLGGVGFQPSEFAKLAVVLFLARYLMHRKNVRRPLGLVVPLAPTRPPRASIPTATWPGNSRHASRTSSGCFTAALPRITRRTPAISHRSIPARSRFPRTTRAPPRRASCRAPFHRRAQHQSLRRRLREKPTHPERTSISNGVGS